MLVGLSKEDTERRRLDFLKGVGRYTHSWARSLAWHLEHTGCVWSHASFELRQGSHAGLLRCFGMLEHPYTFAACSYQIGVFQPEGRTRQPFSEAVGEMTVADAGKA
jgi:hypothetical protein